MRMRNVLKLCSSLFVSIIIAAAANGQNLLVNGSFESGPFIANPPGSLELPVGSTSITGWTVVQSNIDAINGWQAADGTNSLDLNGSSGPGGIAQTFATVSGQVYSVSFSMAGNPAEINFGTPVVTMNVQAAGQFTNVSFNTTGHSLANMGWVTNNWSFTANDSSTTLEFDSTHTPDPTGGPALDNVSVVAVPEPTTLVLCLTGAAVVWVMNSRRSR